MDFTSIVTRLNELTTFMNNVVSLSKKIFQLPSSTTGNKLVAVWNESSEQTEQFNLTDALNNLSTVADGIYELGTITRSGNDFIFSLGFEWKIGGSNYANSSEITIPISLASDGFYRTDIIVLDDSNNIYSVEGIESDTISLQPQNPPNTLILTSIIIYGDTVYNPTSPTITNQNNYVRVLEIPVNLLSGTGTEEEQICEYILLLQESERTILATDSKWNVVIVDEVTPITTNIFTTEFNNKFL